MRMHGMIWYTPWLSQPSYTCPTKYWYLRPQSVIIIIIIAIITILIALIVLSLFLILSTLFLLLLFIITTDDRRRRVVFGNFAFDIIQGLKVEGLKLDKFKV